jgi:hypothetical protein
VKQLLYSQVSGRRSGETPVYKFDWWKAIIGALLASLIAWGSWATRMCQKAEKSEEILDMQVGVLHGRITKVDDRLNDVIWRFFEKELNDCIDAASECTDTE